MGEFSLTHLLLLAIIVLIFFGPSRLPALGQSLGKAIKGFKQGLNEIDADVKPVDDVRAQNAQMLSQQNQHNTNASNNQTVQKEAQKI